jgi:hypothetical protein
MKKFIILSFLFLPLPALAASVTCSVDEGLIGGNFYDYSINLKTNELELLDENIGLSESITIKLDEDFSQKAKEALENSKGVINYPINDTTNFSLFISRYDYFDGRFSKQIGDKLIIANLYCDFDALDNSQTSIVELID